SNFHLIFRSRLRQEDPMKYLFFTLILSLATGYAYAESATEIVAKVEKNLSPPNFRSVYQFTNHRLDGTTAIYDVRFSIKDANHSHGYFLKPEREKGREILRLKDTIWTYMPSVARAVRVADRESFAGGDFSNADVLRVDWLA